MPWPPRQPARHEIEPQELAAYEQVIERRRRFAPAADPEENGGYYGRLLLSPEMAADLSHLGQLVRTRGERGDTYSHHDREFVDQVLSADWKTNVIQRLHIPDALAVGVRIEAINALRNGQEEALTEDEAQLAQFIRAVVAGAVTPELWLGMEERMGERGVLEYTVFVLYLQLTMRLQQAVSMPDPPDDEIDELLAEFTAKTRDVPDYTERIQ